jgi:hypothetical protein
VAAHAQRAGMTVYYAEAISGICAGSSISA